MKGLFQLPIDPSISVNDYCKIDLSENNLKLQKFNAASSKEWELYMNSHLKQNNAKVTYGGYLETRNLYSRSQHFNKKNGQEKRNIHLGIDFWTKEKTPICAAFSGSVHSYQNNTNYGDYGPTIVLEHAIKNLKVYSLYGHLSLESLRNIYVGKKVNSGEMIATLGSSLVNGDYAPHLHFQIIYDLENYFGDYPGVCSVKTLDFYKKNCPDPLSFIQKMPEAT